jgi:hypothetical protein
LDQELSFKKLAKKLENQKDQKARPKAGLFLSSTPKFHILSALDHAPELAV